MFSRESAVNGVALTAVQFEVEKYDVTVLVWVGGKLGMSHLGAEINARSLAFFLSFLTDSSDK